MDMSRVRASGRARCKICGKKIEKGFNWNIKEIDDTELTLLLIGGPQ